MVLVQMLFVKNFVHNALYARSCLQKCLTFQYETRKRLSVQRQQLEQILNYVYC